MGDGNLSNPNGRAIRLRITCDKKYKNIIRNIRASIQRLLPKNKVSIVNRKENCIDISCYSNKWKIFLDWKVGCGSKHEQKICVSTWIKANKAYSKACLKGLFETDGSIYLDRGYKMASFVTTIPTLANDVMKMISDLGFKPNMQIFVSKNGKIKHTIRISKNAEKFIQLLKINKS